MISFWRRPDPTRWLRPALLVCSAWALVFLLWGTSRPHAIPVSDTPSAIGIGASSDDICRRLSWKPFQHLSHDTPRKVFDLIMVNDELDWLEIRLNTTYDHVDYFVIVEAEQTFTGLPKPLTVHDNMDRFAAYRDKIIYHQLDYPPNFHPERTWDREDLQRNAMLTQVFPRLSGVRTPMPGDAILVADVDEIARPETLAALRHCRFPRRLTLRSRFYYYSFQFLHRGPEWAHPQATFYEGPATVLPAHLRGGDGGSAPLLWWDKADLPNAAWHCSSCFATVGELLNKMQSFSHVWMNHEVFRDRDRIVEHIREGKDLWDRKGEEYDRLEGNADVPSYILDHRDRFRYLLDRDGLTAGFSDYQAPAEGQ